MYGVCFMHLASDWCSASVPVIIHVITNNIVLRSKGTRLYLCTRVSIIYKRALIKNMISTMFCERISSRLISPLFYRLPCGKFLWYHTVVFVTVRYQNIFCNKYMVLVIYFSVGWYYRLLHYNWTYCKKTILLGQTVGYEHNLHMSLK